MARVCDECSVDISHKRSDARFCTRACKIKASDRRRIEDGRSVERDRARYASEAEHRRAYAKRYLEEHPEEMRAIRRNRKSRIKAERFLVTERDWLRLIARYRGCCAYCQRRPGTLHHEHIIPIAQGGRHSIGNLLPACPDCNYRKKTKLLVEFRAENREGGESHPNPYRKSPARRLSPVR